MAAVEGEMMTSSSPADSFELLLFDPVLRLCRLGVAAFVVGGCTFGDFTGVDDEVDSNSFFPDVDSFPVSMLS